MKDKTEIKELLQSIDAGLRESAGAFNKINRRLFALETLAEAHEDAFKRLEDRWLVAMKPTFDRIAQLEIDIAQVGDASADRAGAIEARVAKLEMSHKFLNDSNNSQDKIIATLRDNANKRDNSIRQLWSAVFPREFAPPDYVKREIATLAARLLILVGRNKALLDCASGNTTNSNVFIQILKELADG